MDVDKVVLCVTDVGRKQLQHRLMHVKSAAEITELVEKLKTLEQEISALISQQKREGMLFGHFSL